MPLSYSASVAPDMTKASRQHRSSDFQAAPTLSLFNPLKPFSFGEDEDRAGDAFCRFPAARD